MAYMETLSQTRNKTSMMWSMPPTGCLLSKRNMRRQDKQVPIIRKGQGAHLFVSNEIKKVIDASSIDGVSEKKTAERKIFDQTTKPGKSKKLRQSKAKACGEVPPFIYCQLLGAEPTTQKKLGATAGFSMEIDKDKPDVNNIIVDNTKLKGNPAQLPKVQVLAEIYKEHLNFLIDSGALVSVAPLSLVKRQQEDITSTNKTLKYANGEIEMPIGSASVKLYFGNALKPTHYGIEFMLDTNALCYVLTSTS
ncbi:hypothetical protein BDF20DRAFT_991673 [Mycotypha africana]|uniref:uncharacterized protein n=1 Tax=Mycotypha africana TaxID=64632 RepID=UPI0023004B95|nr:uncharacterized protein BDF20DRAFT_991673 [Mycotypha africana]KAI8967673.1 hypothetical protein BDF20DRAFT_991673 [Mycotypha africana]